MGPETPLRIAGPADVAAVVRLVGGFRDFLSSDSPSNAELQMTVSELIEDRSTEFLLIGDPESGYAQIRYRLSIWTGSEDAFLEDVYIDEAARGEGHGRTLVNAAIARARSRGCARIQLDANQRNHGAVKLYESLGFRPLHNEAKWGDAPDLLYTLELR